MLEKTSTDSKMLEKMTKCSVYSTEMEQEDVCWSKMELHVGNDLINLKKTSMHSIYNSIIVMQSSSFCTKQTIINK